MSTALEVMKIFCCFICVTLLWALHIVIKQQFFTFIFAVFLLNLAYSFRQTLSANSHCGIAVKSSGYLCVQYCVCQYHCLVNYAVVQLRPKSPLLHWSNIPHLHTGTINDKFFVFSQSSFSVSILTSSP